MFSTASEGILPGNPCASSTRKKDNANDGLSMQATRGSRDDSPAPSEGEEVISPEQLRFTVAISKAMSKELPLYWLDLTQLKLGPASTGDPRKAPSLSTAHTSQSDS